MQKKHLYVIALVLAASLGSPQALAEKGGKQGHGRHDDDRHGERHDDRRNDRREHSGGDYGRQGAEFHFGTAQRQLVRDYYRPEFRSGNCPPGLAKKGNGCQPPGQARKWTKGRPLPRDVSYYPLPPELMMRLPVPPVGHEYVRVAGDILMIATGSAMVIDAIQDIGR